MAEVLARNRTLQHVAVGGGVDVPVAAMRENRLEQLDVDSSEPGAGKGRPVLRHEDLTVLVGACPRTSRAAPWMMCILPTRIHG